MRGDWRATVNQGEDVLRVGLTGGIASGKSAVADMLAQFGAHLIDTDVVAREVVAPGSAALGEIVERFGVECLAADGTLDRRRMRERVFADAAMRHRLEQILHPAIRKRTLELIQIAAQARRAYAVIVVPLLVETDFASHVDRVLLVECPRALQLERLMQRDGMTVAAAEAMIDAQADPASRRAAAHDIIDNSGSIAWTRAQAWRLHLRYLRAGSLPDRSS